MATWEEIKKHMVQNHAMEEKDSNGVQGTFFFKDGRSHLFFVTKANDDKIFLFAPVAEYSHENLVKLVENNDSVFGVMKIHDMLMLSGSQDMATADAGELDPSLMVGNADILEEKLFGGDKF
jgi:hypothetical protein